MATVLVVDDEEVFCDLFRNLLTEHGHVVYIAHNGSEALTLFQQQRPQFTLLDLRMPEMDGVEVLKRIRAIDPAAPVMIVTAWGSDEKEEEARQLGAVDFLSKRLTFDSIMTKMEQLLEPPPVPMAPGSVLLVDDTSEGRDTFVPILKKHNFNVRLARDGSTALTLVVQAMPEFIVLDMELGTKTDQWAVGKPMSADELLQALRVKHYKGGIILMTFSEDVRLLFQKVGIDTFDILSKPVDSTRLLLALQVGKVLLHQ